MTPRDWESRNRDLLLAELTVLRARLRTGDAAGYPSGVPALPDAQRLHENAADALGGDSALDQLCSGFMLTPFERSVLLLVAGPELVSDFARDLVVAAGSERPTFGLALAALPDAHWSAMIPTGPLRRWNLVELLDPASPTASPLAIDERVLHHLVGAGHLDAGLGAAVRPVLVPDWLPEPFTETARTVFRVWEQARPVLLHGPQADNLRR